MIDWKRVSDLKNEVGTDDFSEVVEIFLEEVEEVIMRLKTTQEHPNLSKDLHFLKGSSLNLGFAAFSSLCESGEKSLQDGLHDDVDLEKILETFETSRQVFLTSPNLA